MGWKKPSHVKRPSIVDILNSKRFFFIWASIEINNHGLQVKVPKKARMQ